MGKISRKGVWPTIICSTLVLLLAPQLLNADNNDPNRPEEPNDPAELLKDKWSAVVQILKNNDIEDEQKKEKISKIVKPLFDFPLMAKLSLGRKHWPKLNESQQEQFTRLFSERLKTSYGKKIALYKDQKLLFKPTKKKNGIVQIPTELLHKDKKVAILYKLRKVDNKWKIYDVGIQGVSVLLTYRSQFDEILSHGTVEDLLSKLKQPPDD
jgi:phospholipid transport system substrate-binding protein